MIQSERHAEKHGFLRTWERIFGLLWCVLHFFIFSLLIPKLCAMLPFSLSGSMVNALYYTVSLVVLLLVYRRYLSAESRRLQENIWRALGMILLGFAVYLAFSFARKLLLQFFGAEPTNYNDELFRSYAAESFLPLCYCTLVAAPFCEELLLRGIVFESLRKLGLFWAYLLSALLFGVIHTWQFLLSQDLLSVLSSCLFYVPAGLVLAWVRRKSGTVFAAMFLHFLLNLLAVWAYL